MANAVSAADITLVKDGGKWRDTTSNREDSSENSSTIECSTYLKFLQANFCEVTFNGFHFLFVLKLHSSSSNLTFVVFLMRLQLLCVQR